jgi:outer membrane murein-binding lipoprotein Lpp
MHKKIPNRRLKQMKMMVKTGGIILVSGLLLAGCGNQAKASTPKTAGQPQLNGEVSTFSDSLLSDFL